MRIQFEIRPDRIQSDRLRPILRVAGAFSICVLAALLLTPHVWCQAVEKTPEKDKAQTPAKLEPAKFQATVEIGGQTRDTQGDHTAKFQEVRDVPAGFFIQKLRLDFKESLQIYIIWV